MIAKGKSKRKNKKEERTAAYIRASSSKQMDNSPTRQRGDCNEIAKRFALPDPSIWFEESSGRSGLKRKGRAALAQLLVDAQDGKFEYLVISEASRMSREKLKHQFELFQRITETGVKIYSNAGEIDLDDFASWMQYSFEGYKAREEAGRLGERVVSGLRTKLGLKEGDTRKPEYLLRAYPGFVKRYYRNGELIHTTRYSDPPKSYIKPPGAVCKLEITDDLEELEAVQEMFAILASGKNSQEAGKAFNKRGMRTKYGKIWVPEEIRRLARRLQYIGKMVYGVRSFAEFNRVTEGPTVFDDICPRLIDQHTYDQAMATLDALKKNTGRKSRFPKYMLSGLLYAPHGRKLFGCIKAGAPTYTDSGADGRTARGGDSYYSIRCEILDNAILNCLRSVLLNPENIELIREELIRGARLVDAVSDPTVAELNAVTEKLNQVAENAMYATHASLLTKMQAEMMKLEQRQEELKHHIEKTEERKRRSVEITEALERLPQALEEPAPELSEVLSGFIQRIELEHVGPGWNVRIDFMEGGSIHLDDRDINGRMECHKAADWLMEHGEATIAEIAKGVGTTVSDANIRLKRARERGRPVVKKSKGVWFYDSQGGGNSIPVCVANVHV